MWFSRVFREVLLFANTYIGQEVSLELSCSNIGFQLNSEAKFSQKRGNIKLHGRF